MTTPTTKSPELQAAIIAEGSAMNRLRKLRTAFDQAFKMWNDHRPAQDAARNEVEPRNAAAMVSHHRLEELRPLIAAQEKIMRDARNTIARHRSQKP